MLLITTKFQKLYKFLLSSIPFSNLIIFFCTEGTDSLSGAKSSNSILSTEILLRTLNATMASLSAADSERNDVSSNVTFATASHQSIAVSTEMDPAWNNCNVNDTSTSTHGSGSGGPGSLQNTGVSAASVQHSSRLGLNSKTDSLALFLNADIEDQVLDDALKVMDDNLYIEQQSNTQLTETRGDFSIERDDQDSPLLSKLSSFSLNEKNTASETDLLLDQISMHSLQKTAVEQEPTVRLIDALQDAEFVQSSAKRLPLEGKEPKKTVYLDLRGDIQDFEKKVREQTFVSVLIMMSLTY